MPQTNDSAVTVAPSGDWQPREVIKLGEYPRDRYNVLIPGAFALQVSPFLRPVAREYALDPDPDHGEVYVQEWRKQGNDFVPKAMGISAVGLGNLADVGGVLDVPQASGRVDDGSVPGVVTYRSTMFMRLPDGSPVVRTRECTLELATLIEEITERIEKKGRENKWDGKPKPWSAEKIAAEIRKETIQAKRFYHRKCETGAKTRTIRALYGIRSKYTPAEIARPFVLAAVVPDVNQPEVRERILDQATSSAAMLFGGGPVGAAPRQLAAGPSAGDIEAAEREAPPAERLTADELDGVRQPDEDADVDQGKPAAELPLWATGAAAATAKKRLVDHLRASAESSNLVNPEPSEGQRKALGRAFEGVPPGEINAGLRIAFPELGEQLTAAQAQAVITAADSYGDAFLGEWHALVEAGDQAAA